MKDESYIKVVIDCTKSTKATGAAATAARSICYVSSDLIGISH